MQAVLTVQPLPAGHLHVTPHALSYARPNFNDYRTRHTRWGTAGCVMALLTCVYTIVCTIGLFKATGWDQLGWLVIGFYGNWIGAGVGFLLGIVGCFRTRHLRIRAVKAMCASAVVAGAPFAAIYLAIQLSQ